MKALASFLIVLLLAFSSLATTRTPVTSDYHPIAAYCSDIDSNKDISWHFCARQHVEGPRAEMYYILYVELKGNPPTKKNPFSLPPTIPDRKVTLVNPETGHGQTLEFDGKMTSTNVEKGVAVALYIIRVPEVYIKWLERGTPMDAYVVVADKKRWMKPTKVERQEIRMIASMEVLVPKESK